MKINNTLDDDGLTKSYYLIIYPMTPPTNPAIYFLIIFIGIVCVCAIIFCVMYAYDKVVKIPRLDYQDEAATRERKSRGPMS